MVKKVVKKVVKPEETNATEEAPKPSEDADFFNDIAMPAAEKEETEKKEEAKPAASDPFDFLNF